MKHFAKTFVFSVIAFTCTANVCKADSCADVLVAAYDKNYSKGSIQYYHSAKSAVCSRHTDSSSSDSSLGISVPGYGDLNASHNISGQELTAWCKSDSENAFFEQKIRLAIDTVHDTVISAWNSCMSAVGAHASISYTDNPGTVILTTSFRSDGTSPNETDIDKISAQNINCTNLEMNGGKIGPAKSFICTRDSFKTSAIAINLKTKISPSALSIPALQRPLVPQFSLTGAQSLADGTVHIQQTGTKITWVYDNPVFTHRLDAYYYTANQAVGTQIRTDKRNGCVVIMLMQITTFGDRSFTHTGSIQPGSGSCDLPINFVETITHTY